MSEISLRENENYITFLDSCKPCFEQIRRGAWEIVLGYWGLGRQMVEYEQSGMLTFDYGSGTMAVVAADFGFRDPTVVYRMKEAALRYPDLESLVVAKANLEHTGLSPNWTNFRRLCLPKDTTHPERYGGIGAVFQSRLSKIESVLIDMEEVAEMQKTEDEQQQWEGVKLIAHDVFVGILENSLPKGKIDRNADYLDYIRSLPCLVCDKQAEPHHVETGGTSIKGTDYATVPFCREHHGELHSLGKAEFERVFVLDLWYEVAKCLETYLIALSRTLGC